MHEDSRCGENGSDPRSGASTTRDGTAGCGPPRDPRALTPGAPRFRQNSRLRTVDAPGHVAPIRETGSARCCVNSPTRPRTSPTACYRACRWSSSVLSSACSSPTAVPCACERVCRPVRRRWHRPRALLPRHDTAWDITRAARAIDRPSRNGDLPRAWSDGNRCPLDRFADGRPPLNGGGFPRYALVLQLDVGVPADPEDLLNTILCEPFPAPLTGAPEAIRHRLAAIL